MVSVYSKVERNEKWYSSIKVLCLGGLKSSIFGELCHSLFTLGPGFMMSVWHGVCGVSQFIAPLYFNPCAFVSDLTVVNKCRSVSATIYNWTCLRCTALLNLLALKIHYCVCIGGNFVVVEPERYSVEGDN